MVESKRSIRKAMKTAFTQIDPETHADISNALQTVLFESDLWATARSIGVYLSVGNEWDTRKIVDQALAEGKHVAVPKTIPETKELVFYEMTDWAQINEKGYFGLEEPNTDVTQPMAKDDIELLIVPGLVFTLSGYRIGFGGGFYDRFLVDYIHPTVSLAHSKQFVDSFPMESFDIPVQFLVTEQGIVK